LEEKVKKKKKKLLWLLADGKYKIKGMLCFALLGFSQ
jgi:hypothetical protein